MDMKAFTDEMLKISAAGWPIQAAQKVLKGGRGIADKIGGKGMAVAIPTSALAGILGWEQAKKMKRRYDIGKIIEEQQAARG